MNKLLDRDRGDHENRGKGTGTVTSDRYQITITQISDTTPFPNFSKPTIVGCFSLMTSDRLFVEGPASLRFCHLPVKPHVQYDLNRHVIQHASTFSDDSEEIQHMETSTLLHLLEWIHRHEERFRRRRPHFVFYRGLMTKLLGTCYENQDGWKIAAMIKSGTIYLRNLETPESTQARQKFKSNPRLKRTSQWGFAFEHFLLSDDPTKKPEPSKPSKDECNIVFHARLGSHDLLYAAEVDGILVKDGNDSNPKKHPELLQKSDLVELKTCRLFPNGQMPHNFRRYNLRKWWCQSFTVGVSNILIGQRDDEGVVQELKLLPLEMLPKLGVEWSSTVCFNFLEQLLSEIKKAINGDESSVYVLEYHPARRVHGRIVINVEVEKHSDKLLPDIL